MATRLKSTLRLIDAPTGLRTTPVKRRAGRIERRREDETASRHQRSGTGSGGIAIATCTDGD